MPVTIELLAYANNLFGGAIMPGRNGTGPEGNGSMTGRKLGPCPETNTNTSTNANVGPGIGRGAGRGMGRGRGRGFGNGQGRGFNTNNANSSENIAANKEEVSNVSAEKIDTNISQDIPIVEITEVEKLPESPESK